MPDPIRLLQPKNSGQQYVDAQDSGAWQGKVPLAAPFNFAGNVQSAELNGRDYAVACVSAAGEATLGKETLLRSTDYRSKGASPSPIKDRRVWIILSPRSLFKCVEPPSGKRVTQQKRVSCLRPSNHPHTACAEQESVFLSHFYARPQRFFTGQNLHNTSINQRAKAAYSCFTCCYSLPSPNQQVKKQTVYHKEDSVHRAFRMVTSTFSSTRTEL